MVFSLPTDDANLFSDIWYDLGDDYMRFVIYGCYSTSRKVDYSFYWRMINYHN